MAAEFDLLGTVQKYDVWKKFVLGAHSPFNNRQCHDPQGFAGHRIGRFVPDTPA
ncbi:MAG: hypothetical protein ABIU95_11350 [Burkholderiales bacterium]